MLSLEIEYKLNFQFNIPFSERKKKNYWTLHAHIDQKGVSKSIYTESNNEKTNCMLINKLVRICNADNQLKQISTNGSKEQKSDRVAT